MATAAGTGSADAVSDVLMALVARLREAGIEPTAEELADTLWLARWAGPGVPRTRPGGFPVPVGSLPGERAEPSPERVRPAGDHAASSRREPEGVPYAATDGRADLFAAAPRGDRAANGTLPVRVPVASALPDAEALQRSLRPLQRFRAPVCPSRTRVDEEATADRAADTGLVVPVFTGIRRREARIRLLMDVSTSMAVWEQTLDELRQVCERAGAFREVRVHYVHPAADGSPGIGTTLTPGSVLRAPAQLADPTGRQLTLVLSDCAGPMWRSGRMQRLVHRWAATSPVAVVQPLPQRMWRRTHLPAVPGVLHRAEGPVGRLMFDPARGPGGGPGLTPVPVLAPAAAALGAWARLVSGSAGISLYAAAGLVGADHGPSPAAPPASEPVDAPARVRAFRRAASPEAAQLIVHLSAVPLVLPVMQLVQRAMLAGTGPSVLAEVLLSGLLRRNPEAEGAPADGRGGLEYDFLDGVRDELLRQLPLGDAQLVLKHCSQYVERHFGRRARNFPAMAAAYLSGSVGRADPEPGDGDLPGLRTFARVSEHVLRRFLPQSTMPVPAPGPAHPGTLSARARSLLNRFRADGTARDLDEAIRLLQGAAAAERDHDRAAAHEALADALLLRWRTRHLAEDLEIARQAALHAAGRRPSAAPMLARVLEIMADEVLAGGITSRVAPYALGREAEARGIPEELQGVWVVRELLVDADERLDRFIRGPGAPGDRGALFRAVDQRIGVLRKLALVRHELDSWPEADGTSVDESWFVTLMLQAVGLADATLEPGGTVDSVWGALAVTAGRLGLDLARHYAGRGPATRHPLPGDPERLREIAGHAVRTLRDGLAVLSEVQWPDDDLAQGWLDLAEAVETAAGGLSDHEAYLAVREALGRALVPAARVPEPELWITCLSRTADVTWDHHQRTGDRSELGFVAVTLETAVGLAGRDHPRRGELLAFRGEVLTACATDRPDAAVDADEAVRSLREALTETPGRHPELARRRLLFGEALRVRHRYGGSLADLHEADWILGAAARESDDLAVEARASLVRGQVGLDLARHTGSRERRQRAADDFRRAAEAAEELGRFAVAADARAQRALILESTAGASHALQEYRRALDLLDRAGRGESGGHPATPSADSVRTRIAALEAGDA
ncbi:SAV_2336 N-terminal domain-related protein [Streptomyces sp. NPDC048639]|uniref:SAV_2336 N-terminal domain-related protein n=1 Tax=Streptomyces sp. NPDC048639 TaxID=3365581 RepID=UPI003713C05D